MHSKFISKFIGNRAHPLTIAVSGQPPPPALRGSSTQALSPPKPDRAPRAVDLRCFDGARGARPVRQQGEARRRGAGYVSEAEVRDLILRSRKKACVGPERVERSVLDLSFNLLRSIPEVLERLPCLRTVYFVQNRISKISSLSSLGATLRSIELGGNRIRVRSSNCMRLRFTDS